MKATQPQQRGSSLLPHSPKASQKSRRVQSNVIGEARGLAFERKPCYREGNQCNPRAPKP